MHPVFLHPGPFFFRREGRITLDFLPSGTSAVIQALSYKSCHTGALSHRGGIRVVQRSPLETAGLIPCPGVLDVEPADPGQQCLG